MLAAAVLVVTLAGCGSSGKITIGDRSDEVATTSADDTTTTTVSEDDDETITTQADEETTTSVDDGSADPDGSGDVTPDESATDVSWSLNATAYTGRDGLKVAYDCPGGGTPGSLWGTSPFTDDSSVCTAAAFAGLITVADGGRVIIEIRPGEDAYEGGDANGITASTYGAWRGSFVLVD